MYVIHTSHSPDRVSPKSPHAWLRHRRSPARGRNTQQRCPPRGACYKSRKKKQRRGRERVKTPLKKLGGMSGAQGAQPKESLTPTTYESVPAEENKTRLDPRSTEDEGMIKIEKQQDKVEDAVGGGGPVFGAGKEEEHKPDLGVTGTG